MKKLLSIVVAFASTLVFAQQTSVNDSISLNEVLVTAARSTVDLATTRITPVAVTVIGQQEIEAKIDQEDLTNIMVNTPGVYVQNQAGGFGETNIWVRGFDQANTAFLLNGQPINASEDGRMFWSNWSGLGDVTQAVEVQRGLGASKLAISSVGGTVNFVFKATAMAPSKTYSAIVGSDDYVRASYAVNTGLLEDGSAFSAAVSYWQGDGYANGTMGKGQTYFFSYGKQITEKLSMNALLTGAPQIHDQAFGEQISSYLEHGKRYNANYGFDAQGNYISERRNNYHKPVFNLTFDYEIDDVSSLSSVFYGSFGRGGGTGDRGNRIRRDDGLIDYAAIIARNTESLFIGYQEDERGYIIRNSMNLHQWFGTVVNYETKINDNLSLDLGFDARTYYGKHFRVVADLLGAYSWNERSNAREAVPTVTQDEVFPVTVWGQTFYNYEKAEKVSYSNDENINYAGIYGQLEYANDSFSAFVQGSVSGQSYVRFEDWNETIENRVSETVTKNGFNIKGGFSVNLSDNSKVFFNAGLYERQPFLDNVFLNFSNFINPVADNEKITSFEAGYRYASNNFTLNVDAYSTNWANRIRTSRNNDYGPENGLTGDFVNVDSGLEQLHTGLEVESTFRASNSLRFRSFLSLGNWEYVGSVLSAVRNDDNQIVQDNGSVDVDGGKVGGGAQTMLGLGAIVNFSYNTFLDVDYRYIDDLYAVGRADKDNIMLPSYGVVDLGFTHNFKLADSKSLALRVNVKNAFSTEYISYLSSANTGGETYMGIDTSNFGRFGKERTMSLALRYTF